MTRSTTILALACLFLGGAQARAGDDSPRGSACALTLRPSAESRGLAVRLGDVATIEGGALERRERLETLDLVPSLGPGIPQALSIEAVRSVLRASGFEAEAAALRGPAEARVETLGRSYAPAELQAAARAFVESALQPVAGIETAVEPPDIPAPIAVPAGRESNELLFERIGPRRDRGYVSLQAEFRVDGRRYLSVPLRARVRAHAYALVLKLGLKREDAVPLDALERQRIEVTDLADPLVADTSELRPLRAARALPAGKPLVRSDFYLPPAVRRGETVKLVARRGALSVSALVVAQKQGVVGDVIAARNLDSQRIVLARVAGPALLEALVPQPDGASRPASVAAPKEEDPHAWEW